MENIDWLLVSIYVVLVVMGWLNIYAARYNEEHKSIFDLTQNYGKQLIWIGGALFIALCIMIIDGKFYAAFSYPIYAFMMFLRTDMDVLVINDTMLVKAEKMDAST